MKAKISELINAVYTSFNDIDLTHITVLAHDIAYDVRQGKQSRYTEYLRGLELEQFFIGLDDYLSKTVDHDDLKLDSFNKKIESIVS